VNHVREVQNIKIALSSEGKFKEDKFGGLEVDRRIIFKYIAMRSVQGKLSELN
jgi:hypothetical protein